MQNPSYSRVDGPIQKTAPQNSQNLDTPKIFKTHNPFDLSYFHYKTQSYGYYEPFFCKHVVPGDRIPYTNGFDIRTLTLKSPLMNKLFINKDYAYIPMTAILPNSWEFIYTNPSQGDDVPNNANCVISSFRSRVLQAFTVFLNQVRLTTALTPTSLSNIINYFLFFEQFFSSGSLLSNLGYKLNPRIFLYDPKNETELVEYNFDTFFDLIFSSILVEGLNLNVDLDGKSYGFIISPKSQSFTISAVNPTQALDIIREHTFSITDNTTLFESILTNIKSFLKTTVTANNIYYAGVSSDEYDNLNVGALLSYQLTCAQFFVNPRVDFVYNAQMYRQNFKSTLYSLYPTTPTSFNNISYVRNGTRINYDEFSGYYLDLAFGYWLPKSLTTALSGNNAYRHSNLIFGYRGSLRYGDYFMAAKPTYFGSGDSDISVSNNEVSSLEVVQKLSIARLQDVSARIGNDYANYLNVMNGVSLPPDYHYPKYLAHSSSEVGSFDVSNTAQNQGDQTSRIKSTGSQAEFDVIIDQVGYILGISSFYMPTVYCKTKDEHFFYHDRFDMFNPLLQNIGQQELNQIIRNDDVSGTFAYQGRNEEYKQSWSIASGAFSDLLSSWCFVIDSNTETRSVIDILQTINPDIIRSKPFEFDRFCSQISGYSLGHRFHFLIAYMNELTAVRPMMQNPNLLF